MVYNIAHRVEIFPPDSMPPLTFPEYMRGVALDFPQASRPASHPQARASPFRPGRRAAVLTSPSQRADEPCRRAAAEPPSHRATAPPSRGSLSRRAAEPPSHRAAETPRRRDAEPPSRRRPTRGRTAAPPRRRAAEPPPPDPPPPVCHRTKWLRGGMRESADRGYFVCGKSLLVCGGTSKRALNSAQLH